VVERNAGRDRELVSWWRCGIRPRRQSDLERNKTSMSVDDIFALEHKLFLPGLDNAGSSSST
jgi:hypothetical protein